MKSIRDMKIVEDVPDVLIDFMIENAKKFKDIGSEDISHAFATKAYDAIELHKGNKHPLLHKLKSYL